MDIDRLRQFVLQPEESAKLDFKIELYKINEPKPTVQAEIQRWADAREQQWAELTKDILALANGNIGTATQIGYLIIGADDKLKPDGTPNLRDVGNTVPTPREILDKVNSYCQIPLPDIKCKKFLLDGINLFVIWIPPSPYLHRLSKQLKTPKKEYSPHTVLIRRGDGEKTYEASPEQQRAIEQEKQTTRLKHFPGETGIPQAKRDASQEKLLQVVTTEVQERLAQSLHNAVWLTLEIERQDYRVQRPFSARVALQSQSPLPLAAGTRIVEVFDRPELARQLLILGEPGAGKTTMMLELAEDLLQRAIADKAEPIPVLLSLSSWKNPEQSIFKWLLGELKRKYGIRQDLAQQWLQKNQLLPLLDGLDEVAPQHQQACAVALNEWLIGELIQRPCGVLICCRREEFEQVVRQPLNLYGAIYLQALTVEQIEDYFAQFELQDVWQTVQQDEALQELLTTPLFLSMFGWVQKQGKFSLSDWRSRTTSERQVEYLLDTYWEAAITRELIIDPNDKQRGILSKTYGTKPLPTRKAVQRALVFAAKALEHELQTEVLIEGMQPHYLKDKLRQWQYWLFLFLGNLLASGTITTVVLFQWSQPPYPSVSWSSFLNSIVLLGLPGGFILSTESKADGTRLIMYPFVQVYCFLLRKKLPTEFRKYIPILHDINLYLRFRLKVLSFKDLKNEVFKPSLEISYWMSNFIWMPLVPLLVGIHELSGELAFALGWKRLGRNLKESFDLIIQNSSVFVNEVDESRYPNHIFLEIITFQYVQMIKQRGGWLLNLAFDILTLFPRLIIFISFISLNLVSALTTEKIEIEKSLTPNHGLKEALRTAFLISILFCISSLVAFQMPATYYRGISCILGLVACFSYLSLIKHLSLRLVLWQSGTIPWNYARFLNYCTERRLLQAGLIHCDERKMRAARS
jgi:hypothetical protein